MPRKTQDEPGLDDTPIHCPSCNAGPGRQDPEYIEGAQTGWFKCARCWTRYVVSYGQTWKPAIGVLVGFTDRSQATEGIIVRINGQLLDMQEPDPVSGQPVGTVFTRYATVCVPA